MKKHLWSLVPLTAFPLLVLSCGSVALLAAENSYTPTTYVDYSNQKEEGGEAFDFAGTKPASNLLFDGKKDAAYGTTPFLVFGGASGNSVSAYSYHDTESLYLLFEVRDTNVLTQATGSNNAYNEDGIEIYIDPLADGGTSPRTDDIQLNLGLSGFSRRLRGTGTGWKSSNVYTEYKTSLMPNTTLNNESDVDEGYYMEVKIPYGILGITKESPACVAFAHADLSHRGDSRKWYGLAGRSDQYKVAATTIPDAYLVLAPNNRLYSKAGYEASLVSNPTVYGHVTDGKGSPIAEASVVAYSSDNPDKKLSMKTDANGSFYFDGVNPNSSFHVEVVKAGHSSYSYDIPSSTLSKCMSGVCSKEICLYPKYLTKVSVSGSISSLSSDLSNYRVSLEGDENYALTNAEGKFTLSVYGGCKNTIVITKAGFEERKILIEADQAKEGTVLEKTEIFPTLALLGNPASSSAQLNSATIYAGRYSEGIVARIDSKYPIAGDERFELYINAGDASFSKAYTNDDYRFVFDGTEGLLLERYNEAQGQFLPQEDASEQISATTTSDTLTSTICYIKASSFGKTNADTVGLAARFNNGTAYETTTTSLSPDGKVSYEHTATYPRIDGEGQVYFAPSNLSDTSMETMFLHATNGSSSESIPENADNFFLFSTKNAEGIQMEILVDDGFSYHSNAQYKTYGIEGLNIILNIDDVLQAAWAMFPKNASETAYDINLRIYSDDTVCYRASHDFAEGTSNQLWWSDRAHTNGISTYAESHPLDSSNYTVEKIRGGKKYTLSFTYEDLLRIGGAPSDKTLTSAKAITYCAWEFSETSKTTVRFYSTGANSRYILKNKAVSVYSTTCADQKNYHPFVSK